MDPEAAGPGKPAATLTSDTTDAASAAPSRAPASWSWSSLDLAAGAAVLVAAGLVGAALLVWWALAFHRANARLWMVPAGLVLLGTPLVAWVSLFASGPCDHRDAPSCTSCPPAARRPPPAAVSVA